MMSGMNGLVTLVTLLSIAWTIGFVYLIWVVSSKETGVVKLVGQVTAIVVLTLAVVLFIYGWSAGGRMGKSCRMMGGEMMGKEKGKMMKEMMKDPEMKKLMMEKMEKGMKK